MLAGVIPTIQSVRASWPHRVSVRIGGVSLALAGILRREIRLSDELEAFRDTVEAPDIKVQVGWAESLQRSPGNPVFDSGAIWTLFHDGPEFVFDFTSPAFGATPSQ